MSRKASEPPRSLGSSAVIPEVDQPKLVEPAELDLDAEASARALIEQLEIGGRAGAFITFEGGEGAGKSTQIAMAGDWLRERDIPYVMTREPGGTPLGQRLRPVILDRESADCTTLAELFLLLADRAQHVFSVIRPATNEGLVVLCDRYVDSTLAYQAGGGGLDEAMVRDACNIATGGLMPDLTLLLNLDPEVGIGRLSRAKDRMESKGLAYHKAVSAAFLSLAEEEPSRISVIDANRPPADVAADVRLEISKLLGLG